MDPLDIILTIIRTLGEKKLAKQLTKIFRRTSPEQWDRLADSWTRAAAAARAKDAEASGKEVAAVMMGIKP